MDLRGIGFEDVNWIELAKNGDSPGSVREPVALLSAAKVTPCVGYGCAMLP
jgi:hypothetical protein